jgi:hypothetical protein
MNNNYFLCVPIPGGVELPRAVLPETGNIYRFRYSPSHQYTKTGAVSNVFQFIILKYISQILVNKTVLKNVKRKCNP